MRIIHLKLLELPPEDFSGLAILHSGTKIYYKDGHDHREDGPAIEYYDGSVEYRINGITHRIGGPAYIHNEGNIQVYQYIIDGKDVTKEQHDLLFDLLKLRNLLDGK